jgi:hypothetical protein
MTRQAQKRGLPGNYKFQIPNYKQIRTEVRCAHNGNDGLASFGQINAYGGNVGDRGLIDN